MNDQAPDEHEFAPVEVVEPRSRRAPFWDRPLPLLALLFGATAGLGLPLLWQSRAFSPRKKVVLSIALILYTALILWLFAKVMLWSWSRIAPFL